MKKNLFFVAVVAAALAGCSSDESLSNVNEGTIENGELVPVELGLSRGIVDVYQTRGTGTVGDTLQDNNEYQSEDLYVLMTNRPKLDADGNLTTPWIFTTVGDLGAQFDGSFKSRPVDAGLTETVGDATIKVWEINYKHFTNEQVKYYPPTSEKSDFFAFYVDDAALEADGETTTNIPTILPEEAADPAEADLSVVEKYVKFQIDGSQDLLAGKASYSSEAPDGFSAKTARAGVKPRIPMKHMLTRLTFTVQPNATAKGVKIDAIEVTSQNKGQLTVAYFDDETRDAIDLITWEEGTADFTLGKLPAGPRVVTEEEKDPELDGVKSSLIYPDLEAGDFLYAITEDDVAADGEGNIGKTRVGEALFVKPQEESYAVTIYYTYPIIGENGAEGVMKMEYPTEIKLSGNAEFEVGYSYNVNIKIYGIEEIMLETTLDKWEPGEEIEIDPDADDEAEADDAGNGDGGNGDGGNG